MTNSRKPRRNISVSSNHNALGIDELEKERRRMAQLHLNNMGQQTTPTKEPEPVQKFKPAALNSDQLPTGSAAEMVAKLKQQFPNADIRQNVQPQPGQKETLQRREKAPPPPLGMPDHMKAKEAASAPPLARDDIFKPNSANLKINTTRTEDDVRVKSLETATRESLPSNNVFYRSDIMLATLSVPDYAYLATVREEGNERLLIDVISGRLDVDARDLTPQDFRFIMYKLRLSSTIKSPHKLTWTSFYGNQNTFTLNKSNLIVRVLEATPEEYQEFYNKGYCIPTVRDEEEYNLLRGSLERHQDFTWKRARYLQGDSVKDKIERAMTLKPDEFFHDINEFKAKFENFGVQETADVVDQKFNTKDAIAFLSDRVNKIQIYLDSNSNHDETMLQQMAERVVTLNAEIDRLTTESANSNTGEAAPRRETIAFSIQLIDFFPDS